MEVMEEDATQEPPFSAQPIVTEPQILEKTFVPPAPGDVITSLLTRNTYTIGTVIGEGHLVSSIRATTLGTMSWPLRC